MLESLNPGDEAGIPISHLKKDFSNIVKLSLSRMAKFFSHAYRYALISIPIQSQADWARSSFERLSFMN